MIPGIVGWIVVGLVVGFVAGKLVNLRGDDPRLGVGAAVAGAVVAGALYALVSGAGVSAWDLWSLLSSAAGAVAGAGAWHAIRSRSISRAHYAPRSSY